MSDLTGEPADPYPLAERGCSKPNRAALPAALQSFPEANVMAAVGTQSDRLLKSEILWPILVIEGAHRCIAIGAMEQHAADDANARPHSDWIGREPACSVHCVNDILFGPDKADVERIARNALHRSGHHRQTLKSPLMLIVGPGPRQQKVGQQAVATSNARRDHGPSPGL